MLNHKLTVNQLIGFTIAFFKIINIFTLWEHFIFTLPRPEAQILQLITDLTGIMELPNISISESESERAVERADPDGRWVSGVSGMIVSDSAGIKQ